MIPEKYEPVQAYLVQQGRTPLQPTPEPTTLTVTQFEAQYGFRPNIPSGAVITSVRETSEGYQLSYHVRGERRAVKRRKRFIGETPPMQVGRKLGLLEGSLLMAKGYAYDPRKGGYVKYETVWGKAEPKRHVGTPPPSVLPGKFMRMEERLLRREGWEYDPKTEQYFKYEIVEEEPRPPPKDMVEWLQRGWEGIREPYRQAFFPTPEERFESMGLFPTRRQTYTGYLIGKVEQAQQWLREAPIERQLMMDPYTMEMEFKKPVVEEAAQALEMAYIPIGMIRAVEVPIAIVPVVYQAITTGEAAKTVSGFVEAPIPTMQRGISQWWEGVTKQPITLITTFSPEQALKHKGLVAGELIGGYLMGQYVYGPALGKAWTSVKWFGGKTKKVFMERFFPEGGLYAKYLQVEAGIIGRERLLYARVTDVLPEEDVFRILTKTKSGWRYTPLKTTVTGKKSTFPSTLWQKPKGFRPTPAKWYPPAPMKATVLRELPRVVPSGKGMALITKQVVKQTTKVTLTQAISPVFVKPMVKTALLAMVVVPSLVKGRMKPFPSIYKLPKEVFRVSMPKLPTYPKEKRKLRRKTVPKLLQLPSEIQRLGQPQLPKEKQVQKDIQIPALADITIQKQIQKQQQVKQYRFRMEDLFRKKRRKKRIGEEWFFKLHPLATPKEVAQLMFVGSHRKKSKRRLKNYEF